MLAFSYFYYQQSESLVRMLRDEMTREAPTEDMVTSSMAAIQRKPLQQKTETSHLLVRGETLQEVAKRYWGESRYYPVLFEYNPDVPSFTEGLILKVPLNRRQVGEVYNDIVINMSHGVFLRYLVQDNETWQSIGEKFLSTAKIDHEELAKLNGSRLEVGQRILVPLSEVEQP